MNISQAAQSAFRRKPGNSGNTENTGNTGNTGNIGDNYVM